MAEQLPQKFGSYTLHKLIARGGMAEIYRATMPGIGGFEKTVAIKKILPHLAEDAEFITMLKDEANILVSISDSNIAQVYDLGRIDDSYFIAMEYVHGLDLSHVMKGLHKQNQMIPVDHALYITSCICAGLHAAHTNTDKDGRPLNIVHRDVSPHNVLISYAGDVKLIDFGVAKAAVKENHTQVGVIKGKLLYMAPEQAMAKELDGRADLFAAGLCLYKMLTNELPFRGDNEFQIYNNILSKEIVPPRELNPQVNQEVNQIVMTLLQRDPDKRYQDGYRAKQDLRRALQNLAPGYTVNRLGRFIEDNFSAAAMQRQNALKDASGPSSIPPMTPSATSVGTGQMLADADIEELQIEEFDLVEDDGSPAHAGAAQPLTPGFNASPANGNLRTKSLDENTGQFGVEQLTPALNNSTENDRKLPGAVYVVGALLVVVAVLFGLTFLDDDAEAPASAEPQASAPVTPDPAPALPATVTVSLDSDPSGAELYRGGDFLGTTPQELTLLRSDEPMTITLSMDGFANRELQFVPDADINEVFELTPADDLGDDGLEDAPLEDDVPQEAEKPAEAAKPTPASAAPKPAAPKQPAKKPAAPAPKPEPKPVVKPIDSGLDLWDDEPVKEAPKKPAAPKKPTKKPAKKKKPAPEKKEDDKPSDILNPFG